MYGAFIREMRRSRHLSQEALAGIAGISQPNLSAYERGRRIPSADTLNKLALACGYQLAATDGDKHIWCALPGDGTPSRAHADARQGFEKLASSASSWSGIRPAASPPRSARSVRRQ
ncbi:MAG: helix-turn-helix domain-containing protein [Acidimicrobiales bacterium]